MGDGVRNTGPGAELRGLAKMAEPMAAVLAWLRPADAGRRTAKGNSVSDTGPFVGCRSGAAGRRQASAGVVDSVI
jgi:hypothetical protein